jgi:hypothetical protein
MLIFGRVAAQHLTTGLTNAEMHPAIVYSNALFTAKHWIVCFGDQIFQGQLIQMLTGHRILLWMVLLWMDQGIA